RSAPASSACSRSRPLMWHLSMEPRIENSHLWHGAQQLLNCFHPFQLRAIVKRCERRGTGNSGSDLWRDQHWFLVLRTAVYDPMPHQVDVGRLGKQSFTTIPKIAKQVFQGFAARRDWNLSPLHLTVRVLDRDRGAFAVPLDLGLPN